MCMYAAYVCVYICSMLFVFVQLNINAAANNLVNITVSRADVHINVYKYVCICVIDIISILVFELDKYVD